MKIALTSRREITSKKGEQYVLYSAVKPTGETLQAFLKPEQDVLPRGAHPSEDVIAQLFEICPVVEVEFNELGRVENIREVAE